MEETGLRLERVTKRFDDVVAVDAFDLEVTEGEFVTLLGPSGCGKTTVLRVVAGFEDPDEGRVRFRGEDVTRRTPQRRGFGMVFQNYALFPHLDVHENVAFGLRARGASRATIEERVRASLRRVNLEGLGERPVQALSGGQQQRVALARALAIEPPLLLLDEPLSNLDAALRERTRTELRLLVKDLGITAVFVTHDQEEAFALSDRIAVLSAGRLRQEGTPEELYRRPVDRFVATFVGRANLLPGRIRRDAGEPAVELAPGARWPVAGDSGGKPPGWEDGAPVEALLRPEDLELADDGPYRGVVHDRRFAGPITSYRVRLEGGGEVEVAGGHGGAAQGAPVAVRPRAGLRLRVFPAEGTTRPHEVGPSDLEPIGSEP